MVGKTIAFIKHIALLLVLINTLLLQEQIYGDYIPPASTNSKAKLYGTGNQMLMAYQRSVVNENMRNKVDARTVGDFNYLRYMASPARREQLEARLDWNYNVIESQKQRAQETDIARGQARLRRAQYPVRAHAQYGFRKLIDEEDKMKLDGLSHLDSDLLIEEIELKNDQKTNNIQNKDRRQLSDLSNAQKVAIAIAIPNKLPGITLHKPQHSGWVPINKARPAIYWSRPNIYFDYTWSPPKAVKYSQPNPKKKTNYPTPRKNNYAYYKPSGSVDGQQTWTNVKTVPMSANTEEEIVISNEIGTEKINTLTFADIVTNDILKEKNRV